MADPDDQPEPAIEPGEVVWGRHDSIRSGAVTIVVSEDWRPNLNARSGAGAMARAAVSVLRTRLRKGGHRDTGTLSQSLQPRVTGSKEHGVATIEPDATRIGWLQAEADRGSEWVSLQIPEVREAAMQRLEEWVAQALQRTKKAK